MAWWLAYEELYGNMDEEYPIMKKREDESEVTSASDEIVSADLPTANYYAAETVPFDWSAGDDTISFDFRTDGYPGNMSAISSSIFDSGPDVIKFGNDSAYLSPLGVDSVFNEDITFEHTLGTEIGATFGESPDSGDYDWDPYSVGYGNTASMEYGFPPKPRPNLEGSSYRKYQEDVSMKDLSDYVSSTYQGHYTNENSDVQTLDLIHSVGDAESFCRSNAIKYLSRYDKKGQAKRDILKAMHYCLLLYYFSGNSQNEITTRGYETF